MTKENALRLYKHYVEIGKKDAAADILSKHPEFEVKEKPKVEVGENAKKPKGK